MSVTVSPRMLPRDRSLSTPDGTRPQHVQAAARQLTNWWWAFRQSRAGRPPARLWRADLCRGACSPSRGRSEDRARVRPLLELPALPLHIVLPAVRLEAVCEVRERVAACGSGGRGGAA